MAKKAQTAIVPMPAITKIEWREPISSSHNVVLNLTIDNESDVLFLVRCWRHHVQAVLTSVVFNEEAHKTISETLLYDYLGDGKFKLFPRVVSANQFYNFFWVNNCYGWRLSEELKIVNVYKKGFFGIVGQLEAPHEIIEKSTVNKIASGCVVTIRLTIVSLDDETPFEIDHVISYLHGAGNLHPEIEGQLLNLKVGDKKHFVVENLFGAFSEENVETFSTDELSEYLDGIEIGDYLLFVDEKNFQYEGFYRGVSESDDNIIEVDFNTPLVDIDFQVGVTVLSIRVAEGHERAAGFPFGFAEDEEEVLENE